MENFVYDIPTRVYFGKGQIRFLGEELRRFGTKVLLVYGGKSIKNSGLYQKVVDILEKEFLEFWEVGGVKPNPELSSVEQGVLICKNFGIQSVLAIGGGSCIDCAKAIAAGACSGKTPWELVEDSSSIERVLPVLCVLTIAATGSEMDGIAVISNPDIREKRPMKHPALRPKVSILDPEYTFSVSKYQTASGTADIFSHLMETYFSHYKGYMQARLAEGLMKTCVFCGRKAMENPEDYEARANLMWTATWAINDMLKCGRPVTWSVHAIEHQLSACYGITHGVGLAVLTPHWMRLVLKKETVEDFAQYARAVWDVDEADPFWMAEEGIRKLEEFYDFLGLPATLRETGVPDKSRFEEMAAKAMPFLEGTYEPLSLMDVIKIYEDSF